MRRKGISKNPEARSVIDPLRQLDPRQLAHIAAISVSWNDIDTQVDIAMCSSLNLSEPMWWAVSSRINGFDGKIAIIKDALAKCQLMQGAQLQTITDTLASLEQYKRYRDGIIHAKILSRDDGVAPTVRRRGFEDEVLVTIEALHALHHRLIHMRMEMESVIALLSCWFLATHQIGAEQQLNAERFQLNFSRLQREQKMRQSYPPLPTFPATRPTDSELED